VDAAQITEYDMDSDDCRFVEKCVLAVNVNLAQQRVVCDGCQVQRSV
jgi:hypothetical protein